MILKVTIDGADWLTDVGVGAMSLTAALRLELGMAQPTPHETSRNYRGPASGAGGPA
jgi:N-hydroxyarylamine O-acetyltransferase